MSTPPITTIRVNLLKTSASTVKERVREAFIKKYGSDKDLQFVEHDEMPELLGMSPRPPSMDQDLINPSITKEVIVDASCGRAILRGSHIFAPGVLGMSKQCTEGDMVRVFVDLEGKCKKGTHDFNPEETGKYFVGTGKVLQPRYKIYGDNVTRSGIAVEMETIPYPHVPSIGDAYLTEGIGLLQNFPSMIAVAALNPLPGESVLDMCAAPGHKTQHIIERMKDTGEVLACEKIQKKVDTMRGKMEELEYKSVKCEQMNSAKTNTLPVSYYDRVLLDAPCSGLGNRPQLPRSNQMTVKMLKSYPVLQKQLFFKAVEVLKPTGTLVYSTCTINHQENELVVAWALEKFPGLQLVPIESQFGSPGWPTTGLTTEQLTMIRRFGPPESSEDAISLHNSIGFFVAKFILKAQ